MIDNKKIGNLILKEREKNKLTQDQLASQLYVTRQAVSKWERGITMPDYEVLLELCKIFNLTPNEIIAGERKEAANAEYIDNIAIDVLKNTTQKIKRIIKFFVSIILILILLFLSYYFILTFNRFQIYKISGSSKNFQILNSLAIVSNESIYLKLEKIISTTKQPDFVEFYFIEDGQKNMIYKTNQDNILIIQNIGYNEYFNNGNFKEALNNLYLDVYYYDNDKENLKIETIKLKVNKLYANNNLTLEKHEIISDDKESNEGKKNENVPIKVKTLFKINENGEYVLNLKNKQKDITLIYSISANCFLVSEKSNQIIEEYTYWFNTKQLTYNLINNSNILSESIYTLDKVTCISGDCSTHAKKYEYFIKEYFNNYCMQ